MLFSIYSKFIFWNSNNYQDSGVVENTKKLEPLIIIDVRTDWNRNINWSSNMDRVSDLPAYITHVSSRRVSHVYSIVCNVHVNADASGVAGNIGRTGSIIMITIQEG